MSHKQHATVADLKEGDTFHAWHGKCTRTVLKKRPMLTMIALDVAAPGSAERLGTWHLMPSEPIEIEAPS